MTFSLCDPGTQNRILWNVGSQVGPKRPLNKKQIWAVRFFLDREQRT